MVINILEDGDPRRIDQTTMAGVSKGPSYASARDLTARETPDAAVEPTAGFGRWEWDITAGVIRWSAQMCRIYGVKPGVQRSFEEFLSLVHPDDRDRLQATVQTAYETGQPYTLEHRIIRPDGVVRLVHARGEVISNDAQRPLRMLGTGQDITAHAQRP